MTAATVPNMPSVTRGSREGLSVVSTPPLTDSLLVNTQTIPVVDSGVRSTPFLTQALTEFGTDIRRNLAFIDQAAIVKAKSGEDHLRFYQVGKPLQGRMIELAPEVNSIDFIGGQSGYDGLRIQLTPDNTVHLDYTTNISTKHHRTKDEKSYRLDAIDSQAAKQLLRLVDDVSQLPHTDRYAYIESLKERLADLVEPEDTGATQPISLYNPRETPPPLPDFRPTVRATRRMALEGDREEKRRLTPMEIVNRGIDEIYFRSGPVGLVAGVATSIIAEGGRAIKRRVREEMRHRKVDRVFSTMAKRLKSATAMVEDMSKRTFISREYAAADENGDKAKDTTVGIDARGPFIRHTIKTRRGDEVFTLFLDHFSLRREARLTPTAVIVEPVQQGKTSRVEGYHINRTDKYALMASDAILANTKLAQRLNTDLATLHLLTPRLRYPTPYQQA